MACRAGCARRLYSLTLNFQKIVGWVLNPPFNMSGGVLPHALSFRPTEVGCASAHAKIVVLSFRAEGCAASRSREIWLRCSIIAASRPGCVGWGYAPRVVFWHFSHLSHFLTFIVLPSMRRRTPPHPQYQSRRLG
jgi:hypothetical protein